MRERRSRAFGMRERGRSRTSGMRERSDGPALPFRGTGGPVAQTCGTVSLPQPERAVSWIRGGTRADARSRGPAARHREQAERYREQAALDRAVPPASRCMDRSRISCMHPIQACMHGPACGSYGTVATIPRDRWSRVLELQDFFF
uniref:Uncharacterized protein n=1 Tax=Oryza glumipatula TaxID=40148 RepID=A0A0D9YMI4_9ORYZ